MIAAISAKGLADCQQGSTEKGKIRILLEKMGYQSKSRNEQKCRKCDPVKNTEHNYKSKYG